MVATIEAIVVQLRKTYNVIKDLFEEFSEKQHSSWMLSEFTVFYDHILEVLKELFRTDGVEINNKEDVIMEAAKEGIIYDVKLWLYLLEKIMEAKSSSNEEKILQEILLVLPSFKKDLLQVVKVLEVRLILGMGMSSPKIKK